MSNSDTKTENDEAVAPTNFIRNIIDSDLANNKFGKSTLGWKTRTGGSACTGLLMQQRFAHDSLLSQNGYLHLGHSKSICLNFGLAKSYKGVCNLRFDDTNPTKEEQEYVDSIIDAVHWLGFDGGENQYYASDYFDTLYAFAERFIEHGLAYVDSLEAEEMRQYRGTLSEPGKDSPHRATLCSRKPGSFQGNESRKFPDGAHVLRLKIDMASPNINLRDPVIYRVRHAEHHRTGNKWCIYPMYDYTHCISDALENITHSICTLNLKTIALFMTALEKLADFGDLMRPLPRQYEFARLNLTYVVLSKRKLIQLVEEKHVDGWDDPRMPTIVGARRRGYTPEGFRLFAERIGVSKAIRGLNIQYLKIACEKISTKKRNVGLVYSIH